ncbi:hypothetical protein IMCC3317_15130 [Kordia antarctica]|uniref:Putative beta-lactamase-inhibitor-like PepSY-like domain-containing protein n=1 Tax=Kordia antarctica TaxID=1218801 RepID=A0A7L4ZJR5_9FLAO|nr:PepSY-like domain-containing protein [Kordia antarctica]QHI36154.1 hypothetical protein IMCC3317_15130 [Kordia antarctica]
MKSLKIILAAFLICTLVAFTSGGDKAPQKVKQAFAKKFPTAKKVKWEKENDSEWEAEFKMNKVEYSANFLENGTWKETEHEIEEKAIPKNVKAALMTVFPGYEIEEAEISETKDGMVYEFEIEKGEIEMEVAINSSGKVVKQEVKKEDND